MSNFWVSNTQGTYFAKHAALENLLLGRHGKLISWQRWGGSNSSLSNDQEGLISCVLTSVWSNFHGKETWYPGKQCWYHCQEIPQWTLCEDTLHSDSWTVYPPGFPSLYWSHHPCIFSTMGKVWNILKVMQGLESPLLQWQERKGTYCYTLDLFVELPMERKDTIVDN